MFTRIFWRNAIERAVKTAAQAGLLLVGAVGKDWVTFDWGKLGWTLLGGALLSILTSAASEPFGPAESPSTV